MSTKLGRKLSAAAGAVDVAEAVVVMAAGAAAMAVVAVDAAAGAGAAEIAETAGIVGKLPLNPMAAF